MGQLIFSRISIDKFKSAANHGNKVDPNEEIFSQKGSAVSTVETEKPIQLVLYGPGESGKTTFAHKLMLMHGNDLSRESRKWRPLICFNILEGVFLVVNNGMRIYRKNFSTQLEKDMAEIVLSRYSTFQYNIHATNLDDDQEVVDAILYLYDKSELFKKLVERRSTFALFDNWLYFVERLRKYPDYAGTDWIPNSEDILRARNRSVGANAFSFLMHDQLYTLTDLGGQKSERMLRLVFSLSLDCLLFFASLANYDEVLFEDHESYRLTDSVRLWKETISNDDFKDKLVILFLNKFDTFQRKYFHLKRKIKPKFVYNIPPPRWSDEDGNKDCPLAIQWFKDLYRNQVPKNKLQDVKIHVISAFDDTKMADVSERAFTFVKNRVDSYMA